MEKIQSFSSIMLYVRISALNLGNIIQYDMGRSAQHKSTCFEKKENLTLPHNILCFFYFLFLNWFRLFITFYAQFPI